MLSGRSYASSASTTTDASASSSGMDAVFSNGKSSSTPPNSVTVPFKSLLRVFGFCFIPTDRSDFHADGPRAGVDRKQGSNLSIYGSSYNRTETSTPPGNMKFTMAEINRATRSFSRYLKVGQGGFGTVYKGKLDNGKWVAVKRAKEIVHEKHLGMEFKSEIQILSQVEHLNLVKFHGYLEHEEERIIVVEYVPNGTLREHLDCVHGDALDLQVRLDIAIDVAHAITYLHMYTDHPIIHRDIKSSNILLTDKMRAKVADFGFARLAADSDATHVSTQVKGTAGYLDPEYLRTYQLTDKSDVYSFGVLLVEITSGRRPIEPKLEVKERVTVRWAMKKLVEGETASVLDPKVEGTGASVAAAERMLRLAFHCMAPSRQERPEMKSCAEKLWRIRKEYRDRQGSSGPVSSSSSNSTVTSTSGGGGG